MKKDKIWIFAGTTEGRLLTRYASQMKMKCCVSTATEYGKSVLGENEGIRVIPGRMDQSKMRAFIRENNIGLAVDATHPFARQVTENICAACEEEKIKYVRCLRERETNDPADHAGETSDGRPISAASVEEAVEYLKKTGGNVLISTGSKELHLYTRIKDYKERCFARVLSTQEAVAEAVRLGFEGKHLIAMQGPYSEELNLAMLKHINAAYFVTKESGGAGGFEEKKKAAQKAGAELIVIARERRRKKPSRGEKTYGRIPCKGKSSMIYYECCKKTRMRLSPSVPKPENPDGFGGKQNMRK